MLFFALGPGARSGMEDSSVFMEKAAPVLESGEAGPPGTKLSSHPPQGSSGSKTPVTGYASVPGVFLHFMTVIFIIIHSLNDIITG